MREIKFRAWDKNTKIMIPWDHLVKSRISFRTFRWALVSENSENIELMQYTGLKDKNGIEIYEGDILRAADGYAGVIEYDSNRAQYFGRNTKLNYIDEEYDTLYTEDGSFKTAEIIGNRYENPELLKEEPTC